MEGGDQGQHIQIKLTFYSITVGSTTLVISIFFIPKGFFSKSMYQVCRCRRYEYGMQNRSGRLWVVWLDLEGKKTLYPSTCDQILKIFYIWKCFRPPYPYITTKIWPESGSVIFIWIRIQTNKIATNRHKNTPNRGINFYFIFL